MNTERMSLPKEAALTGSSFCSWQCLSQTGDTEERGKAAGSGPNLQKPPEGSRPNGNEPRGGFVWPGARVPVKPRRQGSAELFKPASRFYGRSAPGPRSPEDPTRTALGAGRTRLGVLPLEMMWLPPTSMVMPTMPWGGTPPPAEDTTVVTWAPPA
ncbi:hypothetical protein EYF80_048958 [Liparis tanakae]|uniref:Uncharacterized protein n=1 Tax=Liparis tanakae TaxID=230148 RepID=A0A4Z2FIX5_9TELE|nr:hypothetical protein EYF80_048958 [Liparis tanakae]